MVKFKTPWGGMPKKDNSGISILWAIIIISFIFI